MKLPVVDSYHIAISQLKEESKSRISLVDPSLYHLTLHFFGNITDDTISNIIVNFEDLSAKPFDLLLGTPGTIPTNNFRKLRVLFVDLLEGKEGLSDLVLTVHKKLKKMNIQIPKREHLPHLTVGRVKFTKFPDELRKQWLNQKLENIRTTVTSIELIESVLTANGPIYTTIGEFPLIEKQ